MSWEDILKEETPNQQARRIVKTIKEHLRNDKRGSSSFQSENPELREFLEEMLEYWEAKVIRTTDTSGWGGDESEDWDTPR